MNNGHAPCIFCTIVEGKTTAERIYQDETVTAFKDIHPITPVHILVVPNKHINSMDDAGSEDEALIGHMTLVARQLAQQAGLQPSGYRLVINTGSDAGQSVYHLHMHLIGGRPMPFRFE
ncbi:MAG TPA: histidine triad nucleotide-binding protein [Longilinea sp.]|nr:histidine triad nucleotide-binding protein [Longilinea sp.]